MAATVLDVADLLGRFGLVGFTFGPVGARRPRSEDGWAGRTWYATVQLAPGGWAIEPGANADAAARALAERVIGGRACDACARPIALCDAAEQPRAGYCGWRRAPLWEPECCPAPTYAERAARLRRTWSLAGPMLSPLVAPELEPAGGAPCT